MSQKPTWNLDLQFLRWSGNIAATGFLWPGRINHFISEFRL